MTCGSAGFLIVTTGGSPIHIPSEIEALVDRALAEDVASGDPTTDSVIEPELVGRAVVLAKAAGVLAGVNVALLVFRRVDLEVNAEALLSDGSVLEAGDAIAAIEGRAASILLAERTALNFVRHLSGIATETKKYVEAVSGYGARILDTRKTTPGLRKLEKQAVLAGGGSNHRRNLGDGVLIKDNHIKAMRDMDIGLADTVRKARSGAPHTLRIEVEVEDLDQVREALEAGADILLLDNMGLDDMEEAVGMAKGCALTEASGRIDLETVQAVAKTGVDLISVGALTHSAPTLDISLDLL